AHGIPPRWKEAGDTGHPPRAGLLQCRPGSGAPVSGCASVPRDEQLRQEGDRPLLPVRGPGRFTRHRPLALAVSKGAYPRGGKPKSAGTAPSDRRTARAPHRRPYAAERIARWMERPVGAAVSEGTSSPRCPTPVAPRLTEG